MPQKIFTDRSRIEEFQRCNRLRWLTYHEGAEHMGITAKRKPLPLAVGGAVHAGLASLLHHGSVLARNAEDSAVADYWFIVEEAAVQAAVGNFAQFQAALDIGEEAQEMKKALAEAKEDPVLRVALEEQLAKGQTAFDQYLYAEQAALVEGLVRAYARRRLRPLLEQYEVLEVEREGSWLLSSWPRKLKLGHLISDLRADEPNPSSDELEAMGAFEPAGELWFMSRPDALLRERESNQLYILSFKTAAKWDRRKDEDAKRDMQGLSEGVEVEKRLGEWWKCAKDIPEDNWAARNLKDYSKATWSFLRGCAAPPRILGIRYEYMLKGDRLTDSDLSEKLGVDVRSQRSPLIRGYRNAGMTIMDTQWNVHWAYVKEDGSVSKLYYKNWHGAPVWEEQTVKEWIDQLDQSVMAVGEEGREMGWSCKAQSTGYLEEHPLDAIFIPPIVVYRNDDELRDWIEQVESQEVRIAQAVAEVQAAKDEGEKRHLLNIHFPMTRRACEYPVSCSMIRVCFGGDDIRRDPLSSGFYQIRKANHPQEVTGDKS